MAEYGQSLHAACWRFPLRAALALVRPRARRLGHESTSASAGDRASLSKRAQVKAWLAEHFVIVPHAPAGKEAARG